MAAVWGHPLWACAFTYDVSDLRRFRFSLPIMIGESQLLEEFLIDGMSKLTPEMLSRSFAATNIGFARPLGLINEESEERLRRLQAADYFGVNGRDVSGRGCFIGLGVERTALDGHETVTFQRLAYHLASSYRLRRHLRERKEVPLEGWEALLDPDGRILEARGQTESPEAGDALSRASRARERARSGHDVAPTQHWRPRVETRWTLVDAFSREGRRYVVARENQVATPGLEDLTERERQVVASAAFGKSNKEIAYDLGISHATIRVLLARSCARLGVRSRKELLMLPAVRALRR